MINIDDFDSEQGVVLLRPTEKVKDGDNLIMK